MLKNYLRVAYRNLLRRRGHALINILGLAVGLACSTFVVLYVLDELGYERMHGHGQRIVRIVEDRKVEGRESQLATTYGPLAPALEAEVPSVQHAVRVLQNGLLVSRDGMQKHQEDGFLFADSTFFDVFTFPLLHGRPETALDRPFSVVLTESTARKYFGSESPVGRTLLVRSDDKTFDFTVTAVAVDPPRGTHIQFDLLGSFSSMRTLYGAWIEDPRNWEHPPLYTYALLHEGGEAAELEATLPAFALRNMGGDRVKTRTLRVERLGDIRLRSNREGDLTPSSDIAYVYFLSILALFILLLACINFTNLATARAAERAKEVGMRKTLGAMRGQLVLQFFAESTLLVFAALAVAIVLIQMLIPSFNDLSGKAFEADVLLQWKVPFALAAIAVVVVLLAGSYPALYLSRFRPARALKSPGAGAPAAAVVRKGLVVFQFVISIGLIIGTAVVDRQLHYVQNERLGFDKDHVVLVPIRDMQYQINYRTLKEAWDGLEGVMHVTASSGMPGLSSGLHDFVVYPRGAADDSLELMTLTVDHDFAEVYGLEIVAGRDFAEEFLSDEREAFLINESAARRIGWSDPVGQQLTLQVWFQGEIKKAGVVVGVVKDFQYNSLRNAIEPMLLHILPRSYYYDYVSARINAESISETLAAMEAAWSRFNPERPFEYTFLDEQFDALYRVEVRLRGLFGVFAGWAVFIACLGLFGLTAFTTEQRKKEIGVRKVLGATVPGIVVLLSKDLLKLVVVAFVVAVPLAYLATDQWLSDFAHRIEIPGHMFILSGVVAVAVAWSTVGYHAVRAALTDPVRSLRYE